MPKVRICGLQAHCFAFGGFEMQMLSALVAVEATGISIERLDPWSRDDAFHVLHVWGLEPAHSANVHWAKKSGKRVVMTALMPYVSVRAVFGSYLARLDGRAKQRNRLLANVDRFVVVNRGQARSATALFGLPRSKITIIPNIIDERFFKAGEKRVLPGRHVLCTGNVCARKNQLALVRACELAQVPLVLVGPVLCGEEKYGREVERAVARAHNTRWIRGIAHDSDKLIDLYREAIAFALVSFSETQPISLLEATAIGCPIVVADRAYVRQGYYDHAVVVNPKSVASIAAGIRKAISANNGINEKVTVRNECSKVCVGKAYARVYIDCCREASFFSPSS